MDSEQHGRDRVAAQMEAFRSEQDAWDDAAFAELREHLQAHPDDAERMEKIGRVDAQIRGAMHQVSVPGSLRGRLLAAVGTASTAEESSGAAMTEPAAGTGGPVDADDAAASGAAVPQPVDADLVEVERARPRRRFFKQFAWAGGLSAAAAAAIVAALFFPWQGAEKPPEQVTADAVDYFQSDQERGLASAGGESAEFPISAALDDRPAWRWRKIEGFPSAPGRSGVAYDLEYGRTRATLYVVPFRGDPEQEGWARRVSPVLERNATGTTRVAVWHEPTADGRHLLYTLVIDSDPGAEREAEQLFRRLARTDVA